MVALVGLLFLWPVLLIVAIMVKIKMPGGPAFFCQKRVGKDVRQELAVWYNDGSNLLTTGTVIYPDKVRLNCYYYRQYLGGTKGLSSLIGLKCLMKDIEMIFATVLGWKVKFAGERF